MRQRASCSNSSEPAACVIKHTNPCGAATGDDIAEAYTRARDADALAAFGGIVGLNRPIDEMTARAIVSTFIEAVVAPSVVPGGAADSADQSQHARRDGRFRRAGRVTRACARAALDSWRAARCNSVTRSVEAAVDWPTADLKVVTRRQPTAEEWEALRFAWRVMAHVKSNTVIFTDAQRTRAIGAGQMSRVDAVKVATMKAAGWDPSVTRPLADTVAASDAFFPFRDGLDAVAAAGATAVFSRADR